MFRNLLAIAILASALPIHRAQAASAGITAQSSPDTAISAAAVNKPTDLLAPAIDQLSHTVSQTHLERWKGSVREETDGNLRSIERDLRETLPPLLQTADTVPGSVAFSLPVLRNLDALIAVMLRVTTTGRSTAPQNEVQALNNALQVLEGARRSLETQVQQLATAEEQQIADLQSKVKSQAASLAAAQPATPPAAVSSKARRNRKASKPQQ